jgi:membrane protease YdiL (CAAX protease family)
MIHEIETALLRVFPFILLSIVLFLRIRQGKLKSSELMLQKPVSMSRFLLWTLGFVVFALLVEVILFNMGRLETDPWNHTFYPSVIRILGAVVLAPITEELIFRGLFLNFMQRKNLNLHLAIFIQALVFVLAHNFTYKNTFSSNIAIVQGFIDASLFAYARYHTKSLYTSIAMHMSGNLIATLERFVM